VSVSVEDHGPSHAELLRPGVVHLGSPSRRVGGIASGESVHAHRPAALRWDRPSVTRSTRLAEGARFRVNTAPRFSIVSV